MGLDPANEDTDDDGIIDGWELNVYGTNPAINEGKRYVVIFGGVEREPGGQSDGDETNLFWNFVLYGYDTFRSYYGYSESHIITLFFRGDNFGDTISNSNLISEDDYSYHYITHMPSNIIAATNQNLDNTLNSLSSMEDIASLVLMISSHGGQSTFVTWDETSEGEEGTYSYSDLDDHLDNIYDSNSETIDHITVFLGACSSGGVLHNELDPSYLADQNNRIIITSSRWDQLSLSCDDPYGDDETWDSSDWCPDKEYEGQNDDGNTDNSNNEISNEEIIMIELGFHFLQALRGETGYNPNDVLVEPDANGDNQISILEAYNYAVQMDSWRDDYRPETTHHDFNNPNTGEPIVEEPQYDDNGDGDWGEIPSENGDGALGINSYL
jgi:hypothetical protein